MKHIAVNFDDGPVAMTAIESFEQKYQRNLPKLYKELLSQHNALWPKHSYFDYIDLSTGEKDTREISFYGFELPGRDPYDIDRGQFSGTEEYCHDHIIVFGSSGGGDYICFDYREDPKTDDPKVVVMLHDGVDNDNKMPVYPVADNFEAFLDCLYQYEDE